MRDHVKIRAREVLISNFHQQFVNGNKKAITDAIRLVIEVSKGISPELGQQFAYILNRKSEVSEKDRAIINEILEAHQPKEMRDLIQQVVVKPPHLVIHKGDVYYDLSEEKARLMANAFLRQRNTDWYDFISEIQKGEQRQAFNFGNEIGKIWFDTKEVVDLAISRLSEIDVRDQNISFLCGIISGVGDENVTRETIDKLVLHESTSFHAIQLNRFLSVSISDIEKFYPILEINPHYISGFQYVKFTSLPIERLKEVILKLISLGAYGCWLAIEKVHERFNLSENRSQELESLAELVIKQENILNLPSYNALSFYFYEELVKRILQTNPPLDIAKFLAKEIAVACNEFPLKNELHIKNILFLILDKFWDSVWQILSDEILDRNKFSRLNLKELLSKYRNFDDGKLLAWVKKNGIEAGLCLMSFTEIQIKNENNVISLNPLTKAILDLFGKEERILDEFSAKLHSYTSWGSAEPIFQTRIILLNSLLDHSISAVRNLAEKEIKVFKLELEREQKRSKNRDIDNL